MEPTAAEAVFNDARLLARILRSVVEVENAPRSELSACACVSRAFAAAATSDTLWRAALLRRWPGTLQCAGGAAHEALPAGARLRDLYKRRHAAYAAAVAAQSNNGSRGSHGADDAVPLEHLYRFELELFKPLDGAGCALVFAATFNMRIGFAPRQYRFWPPVEDFGAMDDYNRIHTAAKAVRGASYGRFDVSDQASDQGAGRNTHCDLDLTTHVSLLLASMEELRSLRSSLTVFRRCPVLTTTVDLMNDFAVLQADEPVALLENFTPPLLPPPYIPHGYGPNNDLHNSRSEYFNLWSAATHPTYEGAVRVMAAGQLPLEDDFPRGYMMRNNDAECHGGSGPSCYDVTMQVCLDAQEVEGGGWAFPAVQPRARLVFTSQSFDDAPQPSRRDVADILGPLTSWSSEHVVAAAGEAAD